MLSLQDLHKTFGDVIALDGCDFQVERGRMVGLLGPNGAGKTTTMRTIFNLVRPDSGTVIWDGHPIGPDDLLTFGYMPEERGLYPKMKIRDQLSYMGRLHGQSPRESGAKADHWLDVFGLTARRDDKLEALSHGNQQRVQLAAALIHDPELLVLDEPFAGLDPIAVETMSGVIRSLAREGKAVVFSSHQLDLVEDLCEEVVIMNEGRVVVEGNVRRLKDSSPIRHLELDIEGDARGLLDGLEGVRAVDENGSVRTAIIDADLDVRVLMAKAQETGRLRHFSYQTPSLSDLFREAVR